MNLESGRRNERNSLVHISSSTLLYLQSVTFSPPLRGEEGLLVCPSLSLPWHQSDKWSSWGSTSLLPIDLPASDSTQRWSPNWTTSHSTNTRVLQPPLDPSNKHWIIHTWMSYCILHILALYDCWTSGNWFCQTGQSSCWRNFKWDS